MVAPPWRGAISRAMQLERMTIAGLTLCAAWGCGAPQQASGAPASARSPASTTSLTSLNLAASAGSADDADRARGPHIGKCQHSASQERTADGDAEWKESPRRSDSRRSGGFGAEK
jgi:hypothetical protein